MFLKGANITSFLRLSAIWRTLLGQSASVWADVKRAQQRRNMNAIFRASTEILLIRPSVVWFWISLRYGIQYQSDCCIVQTYLKITKQRLYIKVDLDNFQNYYRIKVKRDIKYKTSRHNTYFADMYLQFYKLEKDTVENGVKYLIYSFYIQEASNT